MRRSGYSIFNPKFPMDFNSVEGAKIVSSILFDGGIKKTLHPFYTNKDESLIKNFNVTIEKVIGKIKFRENKNSNACQVTYPNIVGLILTALGLVPGKKVFTNPSIPDFILYGSKEIQSAFLQQAFDDEGTVSKTAIQLSQVHSKVEPPLRLSQIKLLIEDLGIRVSGPYGPYKYEAKSGDSKYAWYIQITNRTDIREFTKKINFSSERKRNALDLLNLPLSKPLLKRGTAFNEVLKVCHELKQEGRTITNKNVAQRLERSTKHISEVTSRLTEKGELKIIRERGRPGKFRNSWEREFDLIQKNT